MFSKITFLKSVRSKEKDEACHSFLENIFTKSVHRGGVRDTYYNLLLVLPCPKAPPAAPIGGWSWYGKIETTYKCPNGHEFLDGSYPNSSANCNLLKQWEPDKQMECQGKAKGPVLYKVGL